MANHTALSAAFDELMKEVEEHEQKATEAKKLVNALAKRLGRDEPFPNLSESPVSRSYVPAPDDFANEPAPAAAVRSYLERRGKAAPLEEIFQALKDGGFAFQGKDDKANMNGLRIAVGKDVKLEKLGGGAIGLSEWYPRRPKEKGRERTGSVEEPPLAAADEEGTDKSSGEQ